MAEHRELLEYEFYGKDCLAGKLPPCATACPLNVNMRDLAGSLQKGNFAAAYRNYRDRTVFPRIVALICREPCRKACLRVDLDDSIRAGLLERALVALAPSTVPPRYNLPPKAQKIAIVGGGVCGLACAQRLGSKGYDVTVYEETKRLGGRLGSGEDPERSQPSDRLDGPGNGGTEDATVGLLTEEILQEEIANQLQFSRIRYEMGCRISTLDALDFDAAFIATGQGGIDFGLAEDMDRASFGTKRPGVFLGGGLSGAAPVAEIGQAVVAAHSIEKYLKIGYMDGIPESFMIEESRITVSIAGVQPAEAIMPSAGSDYTKEEAIREADRCLRCDCTWCMDACELFGHFQKTPRQMIGEAFSSIHTGKGSITKQTSTHVISSCNLCGLCARVCPVDIDIGRMAYDFRHFKRQAGKYPEGYSDYYLRDMIFSSGEGALFRLAPGASGASHLFFPGCQLGAVQPQLIGRVWAYLLDRLPDTAIAMACCGAPADQSGDGALSDRLIAGFKEHWEAMGRPVLICACPTCMKHFRTFLPEATLRSVYEVVDERGLPELVNAGEGAGRSAEAGEDAGQSEEAERSAGSAARRRIAESGVLTVFDPCSSREFGPMQESVRRILRSLGGTLEELPYARENAQCCGIGAHIQGANPSLTETLVHNRIMALDNIYINYCTNCRDAFLLRGKSCYHILDLLFGLDEEIPQASDPKTTPADLPFVLPGLGRRRTHKIEAKNLILQTFFHEEMPGTGVPPIPAGAGADALKVEVGEPMQAGAGADALKVEVGEPMQAGARTDALKVKAGEPTQAGAGAGPLENAGTLFIPPELLLKMNRKLILEEEVARTIDFCERSGIRLYDRGKDCYYGHLQIGLSTIWATWRGAEGGYTLLNVYSHRIKILEETGREGSETEGPLA